MARSFIIERKPRRIRGQEALIKSANEYTKEDLEALALRILNEKN